MTPNRPSTPPYRTVRQRRWEAGWPLDDEGKIVVNGAPTRDYDESQDGYLGPLAWAWMMLHGSVSRPETLPAPKLARLLYPWLIAAGWTPPDSETAKPDCQPFPTSSAHSQAEPPGGDL